MSFPQLVFVAVMSAQHQLFNAASNKVYLTGAAWVIGVPEAPNEWTRTPWLCKPQTFRNGSFCTKSGLTTPAGLHVIPRHFGSKFMKAYCFIAPNLRTGVRVKRDLFLNKREVGNEGSLDLQQLGGRQLGDEDRSRLIWATFDGGGLRD